MPENLYPKLPSAPSISQKSSTLRRSGNTIKALPIIRTNMMESSENIKMLATNY